MRIAFFVWEYPPSIAGGLGTYSQNMAPNLVKQGHDVSIFTLNRGGLPTKEIMEGVEVHRPLIADASKAFSLIVDHSLLNWGASLRFFSDIMLYNILSATKLLNDLIIKEGYKFDLVSYHDWLSSTAGMMIKSNSELPCVFHVHSTEWGRTNGQGSDIVTKIERAAATEANRIITVSRAMKEDLADHGWPRDKIDVVWNGIDPEQYNPEKCASQEVSELRRLYQIGEDESMVLFVGRLSRVKGAQHLIQAMPNVLHQRPKTKLVVLGCGEQEHEVKRLVENLGLSESVKLRFEFVPEKERILHYAAADLCVFPSTYEPFGIVCLEAMAMAKPVVVGARGVVGFAEQVIPDGPNRCGLHVNGWEPNDIAWGISEALQDPHQAKVWGLNGRKRVKECFTWDKTVSETLKVYQKVAQ